MQPCSTLHLPRRLPRRLPACTPPAPPLCKGQCERPWRRIPTSTPRPLPASTAALAASVSAPSAVELFPVPQARNPVPAAVRTALPFAFPACTLVGSALVLAARPAALCCGVLLVPLLLFHAVLPALDMAIGERDLGADADAAAPSSDSEALSVELVPALFLVVQWAAAAMAFIAAGHAGAGAGVGVLLALGHCVGIGSSVGSAMAHELVHSRDARLRALAEWHIASVWHGPYCRTHMHHHLHVGTPLDHQFVPRGLNLYQFAWQYVAGQWVTAWAMDARDTAIQDRHQRVQGQGREQRPQEQLAQDKERPAAATAAAAAAVGGASGDVASMASSAAEAAATSGRGTVGGYGARGRPRWGAMTSAVFCMARQLAVTAAAWLLGGGPAVAVQLTSALVACTYFIIVEYLQHYGLERATLENGRPEPIGPGVAWNSLFPLENALLANLLQHSEHHVSPAKPYTALTTAAGAPRLPVPTLLWGLASMVPPLWSWIMDPWADRASAAAAAAAAAGVGAAAEAPPAQLPQLA